jgi:diketogulonate reductase-like aldo/keto reductase
MSTAAIRATTLPSGATIPVLGQGTWHLGQGRHPRTEEISALRTGIDLGMTLIDTAEMYAAGESEILIGEAIADRRDDVFLVDKVLPTNATRRGTIAACEASLARLGTDHLDLYLLHWRGSIPLQATLDGFQELRAAGMISDWGVSNFDVDDMQELLTTDGGGDCAADEVLYNLTRRGIEWDLLPWCTVEGRPIIAYSPIEQGRLVGQPLLRALGVKHHATSAQIALAWVIAHRGVCAIPEAGSVEHVRENRGALDIQFDEEDIVKLDSAFPPPSRPVPLEML